jgi:hypothetical protein
MALGTVSTTNLQAKALWTPDMEEMHGNPKMRFELTNYIRFGSNRTKGVAIMAQIHDRTTLPVETKRVWFGGGELALEA